MSQPCIITVAITGSLPGKKDNPAVPISVEEQIESTTKRSKPAPRWFTCTCATRKASRLPIRTLRARAGRNPQALPRHDHAALDRRAPGTARARRHAVAKARHGLARHGLGELPDARLRELAELVDWLAAEMVKYKVKPEVEAFDLSMIFQAAAMQKAGKIKGPLHVQFVMGVKNAMPVDREVFEFYVRTLNRISRARPGRAQGSARTRSRCRAGRLSSADTAAPASRTTCA